MTSESQIVAIEKGQTSPPNDSDRVEASQELGSERREVDEAGDGWTGRQPLGRKLSLFRRVGRIVSAPCRRGESLRTCTLVQVLAISQRCVKFGVPLLAAFAKVGGGFDLSGARGCLSVSAKY